MSRAGDVKSKKAFEQKDNKTTRHKRTKSTRNPSPRFTLRVAGLRRSSDSRRPRMIVRKVVTCLRAPSSVPPSVPPSVAKCHPSVIRKSSEVIRASPRIGAPEEPSIIGAPEGHPRASAPAGASDNSPARQGWEARAENPKVPEGRKRPRKNAGPPHRARPARCAAAQPTLPDFVIRDER